MDLALVRPHEAVVACNHMPQSLDQYIALLCRRDAGGFSSRFPHTVLVKSELVCTEISVNITQYRYFKYGHLAHC